ncbi:leucyl aminopeptidase [Sulfurimonas sp. MAG313]|nr:leucyl aminopeptidase [Sulfurimonas sp. MAG313]MDF1881150.1 leucyl aminopeptidase [Sulfurimonas sp. MAG313]
MKISITDKHVYDIQSELTVIFALDTKELLHEGILKELGFKASQDEICYISEFKTLYVGVEANEHDLFRSAAATAIKTLSKFKYTSLKLAQYDINNKDGIFSAIVEGFILGAYTFDTYKSEKSEPTMCEINFSSRNIEDEASTVSELEDILLRAKILAIATNYTRELVNTTPEDLFPLKLAHIAKDLATKNNLECKILDEAALKDENMNAMLDVGRASRHESQLIHLSYKPKNPKAVVSLIGKGLTYDSGGLSLKPASSMVSMKLDKSGGCAVLGIMKAVSELNLPIEVHGIIGAVENMIGGDAYKPDDVLIAKNGMSIEVRNTDAEGRLVLADCLCYAQEKVKADYIFDYATLTGACVVALGHYTTGLMGHSTKLKHSMSRSANNTGELVGSLPFNRFLKKQLKSEVADISNISNKPYGGAITAAMFLDNFIEKENKNKWMHFDIAGPAYVESAWGYNPYGGSGAGVRMTVDWLSNIK